MSSEDTVDTSISNTAQHPASVDAYIRHGWSMVPIPPGTKGPNTKDWNKRENALKSSADLPQYWGVGLAHAYSGTMALDIDNWDRAALELMTWGLSLDDLYNAPDAVVIHSGREGHGKLLYAMPFGLVLTSKQLTEVDEDGKRYPFLDFRCGTQTNTTKQDVLPPSIHPDTLKPYRWAGAGHWQRLPLIPQTLLDRWMTLVDRDTHASIATPDNRSASWDEIRDALRYIDPDCSRDEWIQIGMALHYAGSTTGRLDDALALWDEWSAGSKNKYQGPKHMRQQWGAMRANKDNIVRLGTLFKYARTNGWERPAAQVAHLFKPVDVAGVEQVMTSLDLPPPQMDMRLWPDALRERAEEVAAQRGCDPLVPLFAGLGAICGAIDARTRLELMPGFKVPPVLWLMTIGDPGDKKSPGSRPMLSALTVLEAEGMSPWKRDLLRWEGRQAGHDTAKKAFLQWSSSPESLLGGEPPMVPELDSAPVRPKIVVNDITSQKLVRDAAERPRGLLCALDEMSAWVRKMSDTKGGEDRSSWVVSYEAEPYIMDRVGAGTIACDNFAVSVYGNIQPDVFRAALPNLAVDGLLQRFIPAILRWQHTKIGEPVPDELTLAPKWEGLLRLVYALPAQTYRLSPEAYTTFRDFQHWYERQKVDERVMQSSSAFMTAFGKLEGTCGRLALVLHLIENPFSPTVSKATLERAVNIVKTYVVSSLRYALEGLGNGSPLLRFFSDWVACSVNRTTVTLGTLRSASRRFFEKEGGSMYQIDSRIIHALSVLEDAGWLQRMDDGSDEHRHYAEWAINPRLMLQFDAYRKRREAIRKERAAGSAAAQETHLEEMRTAVGR